MRGGEGNEVGLTGDGRARQQREKKGARFGNVSARDFKKRFFAFVFLGEKNR